MTTTHVDFQSGQLWHLKDLAMGASVVTKEATAASSVVVNLIDADVREGRL